MKKLLAVITALSMCCSSVLFMTSCDTESSDEGYDNYLAEDEESENDYDLVDDDDEESKKDYDFVDDDDEESEDNYDFDYGDEDNKDEFYCMGKNDTCPNKTNNAYDFYCDACDPDGNNVEGDQSDGVVGDNDGDNDIDEDDWEDEWDNYINDKLDEGGY